MDLMGLLGEAGRMERRAHDPCPRCGWPTAEPFQVVSRHATSEGTLTWSRCACGLLRAHRDGAMVVRAGRTARD
jgi:hypothetical protein